MLGALFWLYQLARQFSSFGSICIKPALIADEFGLRCDSGSGTCSSGLGLLPRRSEGARPLTSKHAGWGPLSKPTKGEAWKARWSRCALAQVPDLLPPLSGAARDWGSCSDPYPPMPAALAFRQESVLTGLCKCALSFSVCVKFTYPLL